MSGTQQAAPDRIVRIDIDQGAIVRYSPEIEAERYKAVEDLLTGNRFHLVGTRALAGPYRVRLRRREERLVFDISTDKDRGKQAGPAKRVSLHLVPLRRVIHDYFAICESYFDATSFARPGRLEVIDAGRKALHDEGATLLRDRLADKIEIDHKTARRLFTLICVLHVRA